MTTIGVRELRQNASHYLELVADGESIEITNRGKLVALLTPPARPHLGMSREDLIAHGLLIPGRGRISDVKPVKLPPGSPTASEILEEMRGER